jgi:hypothetical protein
MHITCPCGWHGDLKVDDALVARAAELRAHGAGHRRRKSKWQRMAQRLKLWWQAGLRKRP